MPPGSLRCRARHRTIEEYDTRGALEELADEEADEPRLALVLSAFSRLCPPAARNDSRLRHVACPSAAAMWGVIRHHNGPSGVL